MIPPSIFIRFFSLKQAQSKYNPSQNISNQTRSKSIPSEPSLEWTPQFLPDPDKHNQVVLGLFRSLLHASSQMPQPHHKIWLHHKIKSDFQKYRNEGDPQTLETSIRVGFSQIDTIHEYSRILSQAYSQGENAVVDLYNSHPLFQPTPEEKESKSNNTINQSNTIADSNQGNFQPLGTDKTIL